MLDTGLVWPAGCYRGRRIQAKGRGERFWTIGGNVYLWGIWCMSKYDVFNPTWSRSRRFIVVLITNYKICYVSFLGNVWLIRFSLCFVYHPDCRLHLTLQVNISKTWGFGGEDGLPPLGWSCSCQTPWDFLSILAIVVATSGRGGGGRDVHFFTLAVLPTQRAQVPIIANIVDVQGQ